MDEEDLWLNFVGKTEISVKIARDNLNSDPLPLPSGPELRG